MHAWNPGGSRDVVDAIAPTDFLLGAGQFVNRADHCHPRHAPTLAPRSRGEVRSRVENAQLEPFRTGLTGDRDGQGVVLGCVVTKIEFGVVGFAWGIDDFDRRRIAGWDDVHPSEDDHCGGESHRNLSEPVARLHDTSNRGWSPELLRHGLALDECARPAGRARFRSGWRGPVVPPATLGRSERRRSDGDFATSQKLPLRLQQSSLHGRNPTGAQLTASIC